MPHPRIENTFIIDTSHETSAHADSLELLEFGASIWRAIVENSILHYREFHPYHWV
jgi:hypothetical protein